MPSKATCDGLAVRLGLDKGWCEGRENRPSDSEYSVRPNSGGCVVCGGSMRGLEADMGVVSRVLEITACRTSQSSLAA